MVEIERFKDWERIAERKDIGEWCSISGSYRQDQPPKASNTTTTYLNLDLGLMKDGKLFVRCADYIYNKENFLDELSTYEREIRHQAMVLRKFLRTVEKQKLHPPIIIQATHQGSEHNGGASGGNNSIPQSVAEGA